MAEEGALGISGREHHFERGTAPRLLLGARTAVHPTRAQPEAGSLAHLLGREERLEHLVANRRRDALAGVLHGDHHITSRLSLAVRPGVVLVEMDVAGLDHELAAVRHGVARVER